MADQEPEWIDVSSFEDCGFDIELDTHARRGAAWEWRHRPTTFTGEAQADWQPGRPNLTPDPA